MNNVDVLLLGITATATLYRILFPKYNKKILLIFVVLVSIIAIVQFLWKGFYWQYLPAYLLIAYLISISCVNRASKGFYRTLQQIVLGLLLVVSITPWAIFSPIPTLTKPQGKYAVGTQVFRWIDSTRTEQITKDPFDKRNVIVQAWYPTQQDVKGSHSLYLDGLPNLPPKVGPIPSFLLEHYDQINTYAVANATPLKAQRKWPVVLFLPGYGAARAFYTSLAVGLASHGYVIFCLDHPYEAAITQLANGKLATTIEKLSTG